MAKSEIKITVDTESIVKLQCLAIKCMHNLKIDCNLKHVLISKEGTCTKYTEREFTESEL